MLRSSTRFATGIFAACLFGQAAHAHALAQRYDLPLPLEYFLLAAAAAITVSFVIMVLFWREDGSSGTRRERHVHGSIPIGVIVCCQTFGVCLWALLIAAGLFGNQSTFKNIAPVTVWVIWWVGFGFLCAFVGNLWVLINPWTAAFDLVEWFTRRWGHQISLRVPYPKWLGAWPGCALFLVFAWLELVAPGRDVPRNIAIAIAIYSVMTWAGLVIFGREVWLGRGEVFSMVFGLFGRFAPLQFHHNGRWNWSLRPFAAALLTRVPLERSMVAFTLLILGTVTADGFMETPLWVAIVERLIGDASKGVDSGTYMLLQSLLLAFVPLLLAALYFAFITMMALLSQARAADLAGLFVLSLVPIAIAYHLAHYFNLLAIAGQFIIPLSSDPFGYGWDMFGTTLYRINIGIVDAQFIWYLSVTAIVVGHIIAVWIGHMTAYQVFPKQNAAIRSQYPMIVLMIGYTTLSLWILAQPIIEPAVK